MRLAVTLRLLAIDSFQAAIANDHNYCIDRTTFCKIIWDILNIIEEQLCSLWIKLEMTKVDARASKRAFAFESNTLCQN